MINNVTLLGNLANDAEFRTMSNGKQVANVSVATEESVPDKTNGGFQKKTTFHRVAVFNPNTQKMLRKVGRGSKVHVTAAISYNTYTGSDGVKRTVAELQVRPFQHDISPVSVKRPGADNGDANADTGQDAGREPEQDDMPF